MDDTPVTRAVRERLAGPRDDERAFRIALIGEIGDNLGWLVGALWLPDTAGRLLRPGGIWHAKVHTKELFVTASLAMAFDRGHGLPGRVWASEEPVWIQDVSVEPNFARIAAARADNLHTAIGFPLVSRERFVGVMEYFTDQFRPRLPLLLDLFRELGRLIGPAFDPQDAPGTSPPQ